MIDPILDFIRDEFEFKALEGAQNFYLFKHSGQVWSYCSRYEQYKSTQVEYSNLLAFNNQLGSYYKCLDFAEDCWLDTRKKSVDKKIYKSYSDCWYIVPSIYLLKEIIGYSKFKVKEYKIEFNLYHR